VPFVAGHTRFATSSKATLQGTHPHQWTPATCRRVYDFHTKHQSQGGGTSFVPKTIKVVNVITHNGDFEFYTVNGKTYDMDTIQAWLVRVIGIPVPSPVDSAAVAGMVDVLRTQGCFALSARYAIALGLATSQMEGDHEEMFPSYSHFEEIGRIFEQVLAEMLKTTGWESIYDTAQIRHSFALRVLSKLEPREADLIRPLRRYISDQEDGASLLSFCLVTIDVRARDCLIVCYFMPDCVYLRHVYAVHVDLFDVHSGLFRQ
jgi:hypothetical protein